MRARPSGEVLETAVVVGLSVFLLGSFLVAVGRSGVPSLLVMAADRGHSAVWLGVAALCGVLSAWLAAWSFAGPRALDPAALQWALGRRAPADILRRQLRGPLLVGVLTAGVVAAVAALAARELAWPWPVALVTVWAVLGAALLAAAELQRRDALGTARGAVSGFAVAACGITAAQAWGVVTGLAVVAVAAGSLGWGLRRTPLSVGSACELTPRWQLRRGAENRWLLGASVALMEGSLITGARERTATRASPLLPPAAYRARWPARLAFVVLLRSARRVVGWALLVLVLCLAAAEVWGVGTAAALVLVLELTLTRSLSRAYDVWTASPALARTWGSRTPWLLVALGAPAVTVCLVLAAVVTVAAGPPVGAVLVMLTLPTAVLLRRRSLPRGPGSGLLLSTPAGAVPLDVANRVLAGPDVLLAGLLAVSLLS